MADSRKPPLSRGDSSVSARDSSYWLAVASSRSFASSSSSAFLDSTRGLDASFLQALSHPTSSSRRALWDLRGHTVLPDGDSDSAAVSAAMPTSAIASTDSSPPTSALDFDAMPLVPTRHAVPRSGRAQTTPGAGSTNNSQPESDVLSGMDPRLIKSMPASNGASNSTRRKSNDILERQGVASRHRGHHRPVVVAEVVFESQRYQRVLGWGSKGHLLPLDPSKYMRAVRKPPPSSKRGVGGVLRRRSLGEYSPIRSRSANNDDRFEPLRNDASDMLDEDQVSIDWSHSGTFPDIRLPDVMGSQSKENSRDRARRLTNASRWEWVSPWHLEYPPRPPQGRKQDPDGWEYATSFNHFSIPSTAATLSEELQAHRSRAHDTDNPTLSDRRPQSQTGSTKNPLVSACWSPKSRVRRRKWVRYRRLRSGRSSSEARLSNKSAFDDSFLDSMSGWLRKLGHVRKNWKARYFVLEKSILRYYSDESRSRLKGEVLLFHPATRVHYVDIHLSGGRDNTFAIQVGSDYTLLLQAERLSDRENWMYCIEDALLCRDSYYHDPELACDLRESVAQRRLLSSEALAFDLHDRQPVGLFGRTSPGSSDLVNLVASLHSKSDGLLRAATKSPVLMRLLRQTDNFLESDEMKQHIGDFLIKFKQKYSAAAASVASSPASNAATSRNSDPLFGGAPLNETRRSSMIDFPQELINVTVLQDARSLLALKNYRFFLERSLELIVEHLSDTSFAETSRLTSPRNGRKSSARAWSSTEEGPSDDEWQMARKAALYKLERLTFIPLQDVIYRLLESTVAESDMDLFEHNRRFLSTQVQSFFEIPPALTSPSEWKTAVALLNTMDNYSLPSEKASVLVEVARCVFETHVRERESAGKSAAAMSADDFLPIFIFILARCQLRSVVISRHLISESMITAMMIGETGYYATMLEAAIGFIASFEPPTSGRGSHTASLSSNEVTILSQSPY